MNKLQWKWIVVLGTILLSLFLLYPTYDWYSRTPEERKQMELNRERPKRILNLGLDLRGGSYLLLELDASKLDKKATLQDAMSRAIEVIRNRIDQYGVSETPITKQGDRWIAIQLPGISNTEQAEELIGKTALLEFRLEEEGDQVQKVLEKIQSISYPFNDKGQLDPEVVKILPKGMSVFKGKEQGYYVLSDTVALTGAYLENAKVGTGGGYGYPTVDFTFNRDGAKLFENFTGTHVGRKLAIVLDGIVYTAPVIKTRIGANGEISGTFTMDEARNIAIVLRAGALPAPVNIIERRTVGPSLGEDSIHKGLTSCLIGFIFIVIFMAVYYKMSGTVAVVAMFFNLVFLMACMSYFGATLTLPGIAGVILSLAMAVDANVLILERLREEIHMGKPLPLVISTGYEKVWNTIIDTHMTTWIASVFLFQFGSGPVKGFAVTLTVGLLLSLYTSVFVTRSIYDVWLTSNPKELSI